jgi:uncharacterized protein
MVIRILLLFSALFIVEIYAYQVLRTLVKSKFALVSYQITSVLVLAFIIYSSTKFDRSIGQTQLSMLTMGLVLLVYIPKTMLALILLGEDIFRIGVGTANHLFKNNDSIDFLASRRKFVSQIGLGLAAVPFLSLIYGVTERNLR